MNRSIPFWAVLSILCASTTLSTGCTTNQGAPNQIQPNQGSVPKTQSATPPTPNDRLFTQSTTSAMFTDINQSYAKQQILDLAHAGVLSGVGGGKFNPNGNTTYDQIYPIIAKTFKLAPMPILPTETAPGEGYSGPGYDIYFRSTATWARPYFKTLVLNGRHPGGMYQQSPNQTITREDAVVKMINSLQLGYLMNDLNIPQTFTDANQISSSANPYIALAHEIGLIHGIPDGNGGFSFHPQGTLQRQEIAALAHIYYFQANTLLASGKQYPTTHPSIGYNDSIKRIVGTGPANSNVSITIDDGTQVFHPTATTYAAGTFSLDNFDMSQVKQGNVKMTAVFTNASGTQVGSISTTFAYAPTIITAMATDEQPISKANQTQYVMHGVGTPHQQIHPCAIDSSWRIVYSAPVTVGSDGTWSTTIDVSSLQDGSVTLYGDSSSPSAPGYNIHTAGIGLYVSVIKTTQ